MEIGNLNERIKLAMEGENEILPTTGPACEAHHAHYAHHTLCVMRTPLR